MRMKTRAFAVFVAAAVCCARKGMRSRELERARTFAAAQLSIERMRKQEAPAWSAIREQYETGAGVVREVSSSYDAEIREALENCSRGESPDVNQQVLAKGLQHVAVLAMTRELDAMAEAEPDAREWAARAVAAYFGGIRPTFVRRDGDYFAGKKTLEASADQALEHLNRAAEGRFGEILAARRELEDAIARTYALSVLYEVEEIERLRATDRAACDVKRKEAEIFYRIVRPRVRRRDPKADETIVAMLTGNYDAMSASVIEENLKKGLLNVPLR